MQPLAERLTRRAALLKATRTYFEESDFLEVDTPIAVSAPAPELHIEAPSLTLHLPKGPVTRYLQTSPELSMKRLLAEGLPRIYQIAPVFRDGDYSPQHRPEFRLLEWYRRDASWESLLKDCEGLLRHLCVTLQGSEQLIYQGREINLQRPFRRITVDEAFLEHAGFSILEALEPATLRGQLDRINLPHAPDDRWDDLFHRVFLSRVEPALLAEPDPLFLTHYPAPLGSLARLCPSDSRVAERVELYAGGMELANGFGELTCPVEQRSRFAQERQKRLEAGNADYPLDERFLKSLEKLTESAGMALGIDRLLMLFLDATSIEATWGLPWDLT